MIGRKYGFTAVEIILVILVVVLVAGLGWLYYERSQDQAEVASEDQAKNTDKENTKKTEVCKDGDVSASDGVFCAQDVGVKLSVPDAFKGKFAKIDNYTVMSQQSTKAESKEFGKSIVAYEATYKDENGTRSMMIAKEPLRTFKVRAMIPSIFDKDTLKITDWDDKEVSSINLDGQKFYSYGVGDMGIYSDTYTAVIDDSLTVISLRSEDKLGPDRGEDKVADLDTVKKQFNSRIKNLNLL